MRRRHFTRAVYVLAVIAVASALNLAPSAPAPPRRILACMDENNLPYSSDRGIGIENDVAALLGQALHRDIQTVWYGPHRGLVNHTLGEGRCQILLELPTDMRKKALTSVPIYRSSYVLLSRQDRHLDIRSLDDPRLRKLRIGAQVTGDDFPPPVYVLAKNGSVGNVFGYSMYGKYGDLHPQSQIVDAVVRGDVDLAVVWGPAAGYFARQAPVALDIVPVPRSRTMPQIPLAFDISVAVSPRYPELYREINAALRRNRAGIEKILAKYGVPVVGRTGEGS